MSAKDASGELKTGGEIFEEVVDKLNNLSSAADKTNAATALLGRTGYQLLGVLPDLADAIDRNREEQEKNNATNQIAAQNSLQLHDVLTQLNSLWEDISIKMSGPVVDAFKELLGDAKELADQVSSLNKVLDWLRSQAEDIGSKIRNAIGNAFQWVAEQAHNAQVAVEGFMSSMESVHNQIADRLGRGKGGIFTGMGEGGSQDLSGYLQGGGGSGTESGIVPIPAAEGGKWTPPQTGGGKGKKGDDFTGLDQSLQQASDTMDTLDKKFQQLGSEASMAAKEGGKSFDQLRSQAVADYQDMQAKYQQFQTAVETGSKKAAMEAEKAWHESATKFEQDWRLASEKAKQDMQSITKTADQISSEIDSVLNNAISGKLNWAQEFEKILEKMLSSLIKHLTQQVALWAAHEAQVNSVKAAGGAQGLVIQKTQNTVAGTSDAVTAAKGAYASAAQIPYIGWLIAPAAAAVAFAGVEAFGSAAGGYDIPAATNPITQLHAREMVLPANLAQGVRNMVSGGGPGGGNLTTHNWNVNAMDSKSVADMLRGNPTVVAGIVAQHERSGGRMYRG